MGLPDELLETGDVLDGQTAVELHRAMVGKSRWADRYELVFSAPDDGRAYRVMYQRGATEHQQDSTDPWFHEEAVLAKEVTAHLQLTATWKDLDDLHHGKHLVLSVAELSGVLRTFLEKREELPMLTEDMTDSEITTDAALLHKLLHEALETR